MKNGYVMLSGSWQGNQGKVIIDYIEIYILNHSGKHRNTVVNNKNILVNFIHDFVLLQMTHVKYNHFNWRLVTPWFFKDEFNTDIISSTYEPR